MAGTIALVGSGEFLPASDALDRVLLARITGAPRVIILPTAAAPDGRAVADRWAKMGIEHFTRLGAQVEAALMLTRADAHDPAFVAQIAAANFVYLSGGKPRYLLQTLQATPCWDAIAAIFTAGGVVAGCSAGAMALAGRMISFPALWRTTPALSLAPDFAVVPHFDELPAWLTRGLGGLARRNPIIGVEASTGFVGVGASWRVEGENGVTVFAKGRMTRYHAGAVVTL